MPIDNCQYTFEEITAQVLPSHFQKLEEAMKHPIPASSLSGMKTASKVARQAVGRKKDFSGCYVFLSDAKPVYVGISRSVVRRLIQHLNTKSHLSANFVYRMACRTLPHEMKREQAMNDNQFRAVFIANQRRLQAMSFAFVEIENDLELYLFEAYAAMKLDTSTWNSFRTH